ncbi:uncharacterized protein (TIGR02453 family) [Cryobacterium sp. CAN_C3]|uniref:DUF2461 domain-containing protein n=1 Tax=unclassified Cryobacterium TaxID=2649013 RepID=UPI0018CA1345|nr:DUF2461 domain-containing protein [Cryobacterium sp. CAN_C3]MEC5153025.1 uncharacterized protein (TIGR02453 family) [Cryobacterium sp. CAN_C3]
MSPHFSAQTFDFLDELEHRNEREWFEEHKPVYEHELKRRMLAVIESLNGGMGDFAGDYIRPPTKAMLRIYRDVRFSKDKTPYKTHLAASWPRHGLEKAGAAGYFLQVGVHGVMVAGGAYAPPAPQLRAIRDYVLDHHVELRSLLAAPALGTVAEPFSGNQLSRPPRGFPIDHPAADLLLNRSWALFSTLPGDVALQDNFIDLVIERFRAFQPFIDFLNVPLATATPLEQEAASGRRRFA